MRARPQRFQIQRFDVRRALNDAALLLRNSAEVQDSHEIVLDVPAGEALVQKPTKGRSSRSSGTWPPMASARCPTVAALRLTGRSSPRRRASR